MTDQTEAPEMPQDPLAPVPADVTSHPTPIDANPSPVPSAGTLPAGAEAVADHPTATAASPVSGDAGTASEAAARHSFLQKLHNIVRLVEDGTNATIEFPIREGRDFLSWLATKGI